MVIGASTGPIEKSAVLTGGKSDAELETDVGSALMDEQLDSGVGVAGSIGSSTIDGVEVGVEIT